MFSTFRIGRILGIDINLHWSWVFIFVLVTWTFAAGLLEEAYPAWSDLQRWLAGTLVSVIFFSSILFHELSHSIVARRYGIPVASITLFVFGGVSSLGREPDSAKQEFWIAIVGPLASFAMAIFFAIGFVVFNDVESGVADVSGRLALINTAIGVFNLIPGFPLDGGRVLRSIFWARKRNLLDATRLASRVGEYVAYSIMGIGFLFLFRGDPVSGIWLLLIGNFLRTISVASYQQLVMERTLKGVPASRLARRDYATVGPEQSIAEIVEDFFLAGSGRCLLVVAGEELLGVLTLSDVRRVPRERWSTANAHQAMTPFAELKTAGADDELSDVLKLMAAGRLNQIPVVEGKLLQGMIERSDIIEFIHARQMLDSGTPLDGADPEIARPSR